MSIGLREWGFYWYPEACLTKQCNLWMVFHGCMMNAEDNSHIYGPIAAPNDLVMIMPQAKDCWAAH